MAQRLCRHVIEAQSVFSTGHLSTKQRHLAGDILDEEAWPFGRTHERRQLAKLLPEGWNTPISWRDLDPFPWGARRHCPDCEPFLAQGDSVSNLKTLCTWSDYFSKPLSLDALAEAAGLYRKATPLLTSPPRLKN
jgi:hypothetical protein